MKLFQKEQLHHMASEVFSEMNSNTFVTYPSVFDMCATGTSLRQLFITVNPKLCVAVKRHISNFQRFVRGETFGEQKITVNVNDLDEEETFKDVPTSFLDTPLKSYPLIVTFNMFLLMLDRTIGTSYFNRFPDIRKLSSQETPNSELVHQSLMKRREVSYEKFRESYWPHFNMKLTHKLDPSRVFTEIETHIKGSLHFGKASEAKRALKRYIHLSYKKGSNFDKVERNQIYEIFLDYEKMKVTRGEYDLADLVTDIYLRLKHEKYEGDLMDFVYVDEVQDLTMKQLVILKYISRNVKDGFVFAGDTAQTIARGVHFRFEDVKCLFYKKFLHEERNELNWKLSPLFNLTQNFRTHTGVLNLAQSITELIYHFFPESIDKLDPETSLVCGDPPVLLDSGLHGAMSVIFGNHGNDSENNLISFGSDQVILVRDDCVKDEITKCIGKRAIVLTIFECKGLEFEDVLLYNFFGTSPLEDQWRIIYKYMDDNLLLPADQESLPKFSHAKHNVLCYELKQLYVAITRTKQRLWICEESGGFPLPMVRYWQMLNTIQVKKLDDSYAQEMPVISSSYDWKLQGLKMLEVRNYKIAAQCFEKAGERDWGTYARASELKEAAHNVRSLRLDKSREMLVEAAELFRSISNRKKEAECLFDAEYYEIAGSYYAEFDYQRAGQCFTLAGCFEEAAKNYARANLLNECLYACSKGKLFELGLQYIQNWRGKFDNLIQDAGMDINATEQKFLQKCAYAAYEEQDKESMMRYVNRFSSFKTMQSFLQKLDCINELLELLVDFGKFVDAAKLARKMGNIVREADLLEKGHHYHDASLLYLVSLLAGSLWADDGEGWPLKDFASKEELSLKAKASASKYMPHFHEIVCSNIQLLSSDKYDFHGMKKQLALSTKNRDLMGEILAVRKILYILLSESKKSDPRNKVSITTLFWHWNLWKDNIVKILSYLQSIKGKEPAEYTEYGEFCLGYLGVRKRSDDPDEGYFMLYPDSKWVKSVARRADKKNSLNVWQLVSAGERYWCSEILSVGIKVLETLESVLKQGSTKFMPSYCLTRVPIQIFEVAASLMTHGRFLEQTSVDWLSVTSYIDLSAEEYFRSVFSMDNKMLKTKDSIALTVSSRNIWKKAIFTRFGSLVFEKSSLAQVTQMVVALLGTVRQKEVSSEFHIGSPWQRFLDDTVQGGDKVCHFRDALSDLYKAKSDGYHLISPSCFVYLLDRLLVMVSCFGKCLFATRSSVIEWFIHLDWKVNRETFLLGSGEASMVTSTFDFLASTVHELLINWQETKEWVKKTGPKRGQAQPTITSSLQLLNLKLVILLSLICLNTDRYLDLLNDVVLRSDIMARLPAKFRDVIVERRGSSFRCVMAEALNRIDDSLVIVWNPEIDHKKMYVRHAVFLRRVWIKDKILKDLRIKL